MSILSFGLNFVEDVDARAHPPGGSGCAEPVELRLELEFWRRTCRRACRGSKIFQRTLNYFPEYARTADITLVLAGPAKMQIPEHSRVRALGYVSDALRAALLAHAQLLIVPSRYEASCCSRSGTAASLHSSTRAAARSTVGSGAPTAGSPIDPLASSARHSTSCSPMTTP